MNRTLKSQIAKICQESHLRWNKALPIALTRIRAVPCSGLGLSPYELMFGQPYPTHRPVNANSTVIVGDEEIRTYVRHLKYVLLSLQDQAIIHQSLPADTPCHLVEPGDWILIKEWRKEPLTPQWSGPFEVLLTTHTVVKVSERKNWVHHSRIKKVPTPEDETRHTKAGKRLDC